MWTVCGVQWYYTSAEEQARVEVVVVWDIPEYVLRRRLGLEQGLSCHVHLGNCAVRHCCFLLLLSCKLSQ